MVGIWVYCLGDCFWFGVVMWVNLCVFVFVRGLCGTGFWVFSEFFLALGCYVEFLI